MKIESVLQKRCVFFIGALFITSGGLVAMRRDQSGAGYDPKAPLLGTSTGASGSVDYGTSKEDSDVVAEFKDLDISDDEKIAKQVDSMRQLYSFIGTGNLDAFIHSIHAGCGEELYHNPAIKKKMKKIHSPIWEIFWHIFKNETSTHKETWYKMFQVLVFGPSDKPYETPIKIRLESDTTPLHIAAWNNRRGLIAFLITSKICDPNVFDSDNQTALGDAKTVEIAQCLIDNGVRPLKKCEDSGEDLEYESWLNYIRLWRDCDSDVWRVVSLRDAQGSGDCVIL